MNKTAIKPTPVPKTPNTVKRTVSSEKRAVASGRLPNAHYRSREYLIDREVEKLMEVARRNRNGHRDATTILIAYRHGLRASELCALRWEQVDLVHARLAVVRAKNGLASTVRRLQRERASGRYVFESERGAPFTVAGFRRMVERLGKAAELPFSVHPHMLRHACGFKLANQGVDTRALQHYLGHKNIQHTVRYTELAPDRFKDFWRD
jgi:integrase